MKTRILSTLTLLVSLIFMQSCSKVTVVEHEEEKSHVQITVSPFTLTMEDMGTTTRSSNLSDLATRLSFAVFDSKGTLVDEVVHQVSSASDFGVINLELYPGSYMMVAVAHSGADNAEVKSINSVTLPGNTFTDTFSAMNVFTVKSGEDYNLDMSLPRLTSVFAFQLADTPPEDLKEIKVILNTDGETSTSLILNPTTGYVVGDWTFTYTIPAAKFKEENPIYFIQKSGKTEVDIEATAYDNDGEVIISHTISNVSLVPGKKTTATGYFFKSAVSGSFKVNGAWTTEEITFN